MNKLNDKLQAKLEDQKRTGALSLSSADIADFSTEKKKIEPVKGNVTAKVPEEALNEPVINTGSKGDPGKALAGDIKTTANDEKTTRTMAHDTNLIPVVTISDDDREVFLDSIITGKRFMLPFSLFKGKITGKFRSRSQSESMAIINRLNWELNEKRVVNALDYSTRLRNMVLAAQVDEMRNSKYEPLKAPLMRTVSGDTVTEPGWLKQVELWENEHEGLVSALYSALQEFEQKYWVMVNNASDQNFWNPAESTLK